MISLKPCNYCHGKPRRSDSPYCSDRCENKKHQWNMRNASRKAKQNRAYRAKCSEQERIEAAKIYQREYNDLRKVRKLLHEEDTTPRRLRPEQRVKIWNIVTGEIKEMKL